MPVPGVQERYDDNGKGIAQDPFTLLAPDFSGFSYLSPIVLYLGAAGKDMPCGHQNNRKNMTRGLIPLANDPEKHENLQFLKEHPVISTIETTENCQ